MNELGEVVWRLVVVLAGTVLGGIVGVFVLTVGFYCIGYGFTKGRIQALGEIIKRKT